MICAYIDAYRSRFGVEPICAVLSEHGITIAPSTYYARRRCPITQAEWDQAHLVSRLVDLHHRDLLGVPGTTTPTWDGAGGAAPTG